MPAPAHLHLPAASDAPRRARHWALATVRSWDEAAVDDADLSLVVSELVANAVLHGAGPVDVSLVPVLPTRVRVEVRSVSDATAVTARPQPSDALSGRGLVIVDAVSRSWGAETAGERLTVWAELGVADQGRVRPCVSA